MNRSANNVLDREDFDKLVDSFCSNIGKEIQHQTAENIFRLIDLSGKLNR